MRGEEQLAFRPAPFTLGVDKMRRTFFLVRPPADAGGPVTGSDMTSTQQPFRFVIWHVALLRKLTKVHNCVQSCERAQTLFGATFGE